MLAIFVALIGAKDKGRDKGKDKGKDKDRGDRKHDDIPTGYPTSAPSRAPFHDPYRVHSHAGPLLHMPTGYPTSAPSHAPSYAPHPRGGPLLHMPTGMPTRMPSSSLTIVLTITVTLVVTGFSSYAHFEAVAEKLLEGAIKKLLQDVPMTCTITPSTTSSSQQLRSTTPVNLDVKLAFMKDPNAPTESMVRQAVTTDALTTSMRSKMAKSSDPNAVSMAPTTSFAVQSVTPSTTSTTPSETSSSSSSNLNLIMPLVIGGFAILLLCLGASYSYYAMRKGKNAKKEAAIETESRNLGAHDAVSHFSLDA